jgi:hypothetical protein
MQICPWCCRAVLDPAGVDVVDSGNWSLKLNPVANVVNIFMAVTYSKSFKAFSLHKVAI